MIPRSTALEIRVRDRARARKLRGAFFGALALLIGALPWHAAFAQTYPSRVVRLVVGAPPGGGADIVARLLAARLQEQWKSAVIVENRPGAGGIIGADSVARASPDGYTLLSGFTSQFLVHPAQQDKPAYDPVRDFEPVSMLGILPVVLLAGPALPANSVRELIQYAKARPGTLDFASASSGFFFVAEIFNRQAGTDLRAVPFTGTATAVNAVLAGTVPLAFVDLPPAIGPIRAGRLRALGVAAARRIDALPEVAAIAESLPGFEFSLWAAVFAPARTPADIVARLNREIARAVETPELREKLLAAGFIPAAGTPQELAETVRRYLALIAPLSPPGAR